VSWRSRYGTREPEVDELLRRKVFVDLYAVVRQAMRIGLDFRA
jgi:predicted RecB family nuclease